MLAAVLLMLPLVSFAHEAPLRYDRVHLSARAQTQIENDTIIATLYAQQEGRDTVQLANLVNQQINKAIEYLKQHAAIKVQTSSYTTSPVYQSNKITGWRVRQSIRLESQDMALMSSVLGELQQTLALQGITFAVSPELKNSTDDELISEALNAFEQRAKNITQQLGRKNYKIVDINIVTSGDGLIRRNYEAAAMASKVAAPAIEAGERTLQVTVNAEIELE